MVNGDMDERLYHTQKGAGRPRVISSITTVSII
jgi:hypothetical protein